MSILTLLYTTDKDGDFCDPETDKTWDVDRLFFNEKITAKSVICGFETLIDRWRDLMHCKVCVVCDTQKKNKTPGEEFLHKIKQDLRFPADFLPFYAPSIQSAIAQAKYSTRANDIYCVGDKEQIEAAAPFASEVILTNVGVTGEEGNHFISLQDKYYLPQYLREEIRKSNMNSNHPWFTREPVRQVKDPNYYAVRVNWLRNPPIEL